MQANTLRCGRGAHCRGRVALPEERASQLVNFGIATDPLLSMSASDPITINFDYSVPPPPMGCLYEVFC
ncbi:unnamed protein product [Cylicostephanus goldi]|uniref:Uncharacterized protein n=1 Tax=Cylicostephanus goldi TaxID=71465 RepID=A0A3P6QNS6_CYLGO|nr:unnamed protein product [Cylicostephanus goldi]